MQSFQNAAAAVCIACICAEVTALLTGTGWAGRCIKAVAGLYILVVLFRLAPGVKPELKSSMEVVPSSVRIQSAETSILQKTQERLESSLQAECMQRFGVPIELDITLTQEGQTVQAGSAGFTILSECTDAEKRQVAAYLQEELGTASVWEMQEEVG